MAKVKEPTHIPLLCSAMSGTEMVWGQAGLKNPNYSTPIPFSLPASSHPVQGFAHLGWERLIPVPTLHMTQPAQSDVSTPPPNFTPDTGIGSAMANRKFLETHWNFGGKVTLPTHPPPSPHPRCRNMFLRTWEPSLIQLLQSFTDQRCRKEAGSQSQNRSLTVRRSHPFPPLFRQVKVG